MSMMNPVNQIIMEEIGLTIDQNYRVIDQDSRQPIMINDKVLKYSQYHCVPVRNQEQLFDPMSQYKQMSILFDYFIDKIGATEGISVDLYYDIHNGTALEAKNSERTITTNDYNSEPLKYVDMMMQLNGSSTSELTGYDIPEKKTNTRKKAKVDFSK